MIEFMVLALPRSATTWCSNWLTTDDTLCLHDPLVNYHYSDLDSIPSTKRLGVVCTGLFRFKSWLDSHPARKVILHRPIQDINSSLSRLGMPPVTAEEVKALGELSGIHTDYEQIFDNPAPLYEYLLKKPFDTDRHHLLKQIEMQPNFAGITINPAACRRLVDEIRSATC